MLNQVFFAGASDGLALGNMLFLLIAFVILMLLLKKFAWGPVVKMMDDRANKVAHDLDSAEDARQQAEKLSKERQEQLMAARTDANKIVADAKKSADAQGKKIVADAQTIAQTLKDRAATQIEQDRLKAMTSAKNDVADLSVTIAQKIIQKELKLDDQKALIDAYIDGLGEK